MGSKRKPAVELKDWMAERDRQVAARAFSRPDEKPLTKNHLRYMAAIRANPVVLSVGPPGTGKSRLACQVAAELLRAGQVDQIVVTRPLVACGEYLGPVPGTEAEKLAPYTAALAKGLARYLGKAEYDRLVREERVQVRSLAAMRGETFERAVVIADEAENCTYEQLQMLLSRLGVGSRIVVNGDVHQADTVRGAANPLARVVLKLRGLEGVAFVKLTRADCLRPELVQLIDERLAAPD